MDSGLGRFAVARLTFGSRFVAGCLIALTLVLLAIPDEADLQPTMAAGLQSFSDGGDDGDDGDANDSHVAVRHTTVATVDRAVRGDGIFAPTDIGVDAVFSSRIRAGGSVSSRGPPTMRSITPSISGPRVAPFHEAMCGAPSAQVISRASKSFEGATSRAQPSSDKRIVSARHGFDMNNKLALARDAAATCDLLCLAISTREREGLK